ncbi:MAG: hypothetical protein ACR2NB_08950, partial [Solirubrobacteraceae bacterium]
MEQQSTIIDLRGSDSSSAGAEFGVLADPSGRRGRRLCRAGRAIAVLFAVWLVALALSGLGLLPATGIPLASRGGAGTAPPPMGDRNPLVAAKDAPPALLAVRATDTTAPGSRRVPVIAGPGPT